MKDRAETLGYVGLGLMGLPMALRLRQARHALSVWNRSSAKAQPLQQAGATVCARPADVARASSIVFMCLTDSAAVEQVVFGEGGLAGVEGQGRLVVDFSSITPEATRGMAERLLAANGMRWIDAPISGGTQGAKEGTLAVMVGGRQEDVDRVRPYVLAMAQRFTRMGPLGAGQTTKLCNQVIVGGTMAILAEATRLAVNAGIDPLMLPQALAGGFADSKPLQLFVPRMAQAIHEPPLGHTYTMLKDLDSVVDLARQTGTPVPMTAIASQLFRQLTAARGQHSDALEIFKLSEKQPSR